MNIVLRTHRFVSDEHAVLLVGECADRDRVLVRMESKPDGDESYSIILRREEWQTLCDLDPFDEAEAALGDVVQSLSFIEADGECRTSLDVIEVANRQTVYLEMTHVGDVPEDSLTVKLDSIEWSHLITLDLLDPIPAPSEEDESMLPDDDPPSGQIH